MLNKLLAMLGFAQKSGNLISGENTVELYIPKNKISLLIITTDASDNTKEKFIGLANRYKVQYIVFGTMEVLSQSIGKYNRAIFGVANKKFSREIKKIYDEVIEKENQITKE